MLKLLYFTIEELCDMSSGVCKKCISQIEVFRNAGFHVDVVYAQKGMLCIEKNHIKKGANFRYLPEMHTFFIKNHLPAKANRLSIQSRSYGCRQKFRYPEPVPDSGCSEYPAQHICGRNHKKEITAGRDHKGRFPHAKPF